MFKSYHRYKMPSFTRIITVYQCRCAYYNDAWKGADDPNLLCPEHHQPLKHVLEERVFGVRPKNTSTYRYRSFKEMA